jgi:hypothetical protein
MFNSAIRFVAIGVRSLHGVNVLWCRLAQWIEIWFVVAEAHRIGVRISAGRACSAQFALIIQSYVG